MQKYGIFAKGERAAPRLSPRPRPRRRGFPAFLFKKRNKAARFFHLLPMIALQQMVFVTLAASPDYVRGGNCPALPRARTAAPSRRRKAGPPRHARLRETALPKQGGLAVAHDGCPVLHGPAYKGIDVRKQAPRPIRKRIFHTGRHFGVYLARNVAVLLQRTQEGHTLWFATSPHKEVFRQLQENPAAELLAMQGNTSVRITGKAVFDVPDGICQEIYENNPVLSRLYPAYKALAYFRLTAEKSDFYDLTPTPPLLEHTEY